MTTAASLIAPALASGVAPLRRARAGAVRALGCAFALALGCATSSPSPADVATRQEALARTLDSLPVEATGESLVVRLAFGAEADLDLYVTDPAQETVYFGNSPSGGGGRLRDDRRCDAPAPRVETIVFEKRTRGLVRVGVDAPEACRDDVRAVPFVVELRAGELRLERRGLARPGRFEVIVLEAEVDGAPPRPRDAVIDRSVP